MNKPKSHNLITGIRAGKPFKSRGISIELMSRDFSLVKVMIKKVGDVVSIVFKKRKD